MIALSPARFGLAEVLAGEFTLAGVRLPLGAEEDHGQEEGGMTVPAPSKTPES
jgi:hypothetical protein